MKEEVKKEEVKGQLEEAKDIINPPIEAPPQKESALITDTRIKYLAAERLKEKEAELRLMEERIDNKMQEFREFVRNTETMGIGKAGGNYALTDDEKAQLRVKRLLEPTGLNI